MGGRYGAVEQDNTKRREIANLLSNWMSERLTKVKNPYAETPRILSCSRLLQQGA